MSRIVFFSNWEVFNNLALLPPAPLKNVKGLAAFMVSRGASELYSLYNFSYAYMFCIKCFLSFFSGLQHKVAVEVRMWSGWTGWRGRGGCHWLFLIF